ncbi:MAG TPA: hypothetical protein VEJ42_09405 [Streptosporangiaceae bacterium]|nr:hypothetical protein [Streptosporangiaceae bacterium]
MVAVSAIAEVDAAAAQIATMTPLTGMVLARARTVSSGRLALYW